MKILSPRGAWAISSGPLRSGLQPLLSGRHKLLVADDNPLVACFAFKAPFAVEAADGSSARRTFPFK
jgi:hypothetical protein